MEIRKAREASSVFLALLAMLAAFSHPVAAQSFPDTEEGLRQFLVSVAQVGAEQDKALAKKHVLATVIPKYQDWFRQAFGDEHGDRLAKAYKGETSDDDRDIERMSRVLTDLGKQEHGPLQVRKLTSAAEAADSQRVRTAFEAAKSPVVFYQAQVPNRDPRFRAQRALFVYVDGGFRRISELTLSVLPNAEPYRIRMGGSVQQAQLTHRVRPTYPPEARDERVEGTVRLQVWVTREGAVDKLEIVSGPALLQKSALDAVRQWRYRPTILNGVPVEVVTTVDVVYTLR